MASQQRLDAGAAYSLPAGAFANAAKDLTKEAATSSQARQAAVRVRKTSPA